MLSDLGMNLETILNEKADKLTPSNIKDGVKTLGVTGTFTSDADATAQDILNGKTAYVKGEKITGAFDAGSHNATIEVGNGTQLNITTMLTEVGSNVDTENVTSMSQSFKGFTGLKSVPQFRMDKVTDTSYMFDSCTGLTKAELPPAPSLTNANYMFNGCTALTEVVLQSTPSLTTANYIFNNTKVAKAVFSDLSGLTSIGNLYKGASYLRELHLLNLESMTSLASAFRDNNAIRKLVCSNTKNIVDLGNTFYGCRQLRTFEFDYSGLQTLHATFANCVNLEPITIENGHNITSMMYAFYHCTLLKSVTLLDTGKVQNIAEIFIEDTLLNTVTFEDASSLNQIWGAFGNCKALKNLSGFKDLGKAFTATTNNAYVLDLGACTNLTYESLIGLINNLYDLNLTYDVANGGTLYTQGLILGSTNLGKLSSEEIRNSYCKGLDSVVKEVII